jgi:hypothetical protein
MTGCSPVHVAAHDSIITTISDNWGVSRHEGILNLGIVVLLATNTRCAVVVGRGHLADLWPHACCPHACCSARP